MAGATWPDSMSSPRTIRSSAFSEEMNVPIFWPTNGDSASARSWRSAPLSQRPSVSPTHFHEHSLGGDGAPEIRQPAVAPDVEDHVVAMCAVGEVVAGVVDYVVCADRADRVDLGRAAHTRDLGSEALGDLHREGAPLRMPRRSGSSARA
jgi:hypothetical protein